MHIVTIMARYILWKKIVLVDKWSHPDQVLPYRMVSSFWCVWCHLEGVWSPTCIFICCKSKCKASIVCVSSSRSHGLEGRSFSVLVGQSKFCKIPLFPFLRQILSIVILSTSLLMILFVPLCLWKEWFAYLLAIAEEESLNSSYSGIFSFSLTSGSFAGAWSSFVFMLGGYQATRLQGRIFQDNWNLRDSQHFFFFFFFFFLPRKVVEIIPLMSWMGYSSM